MLDIQNSERDERGACLALTEDLLDAQLHELRDDALADFAALSRTDGAPRWPIVAAAFRLELAETLSLLPAWGEAPTIRQLTAGELDAAARRAQDVASDPVLARLLSRDVAASATVAPLSERHDLPGERDEVDAATVVELLEGATILFADERAFEHWPAGRRLPIYGTQAFILPDRGSALVVASVEPFERSVKPSRDASWHQNCGAVRFWGALRRTPVRDVTVQVPEERDGDDDATNVGFVTASGAVYSLTGYGTRFFITRSLR